MRRNAVNSPVLNGGYGSRIPSIGQPKQVLAPSAARVLFSPSWAGAAHIVQLGPVRVEQIVPQPAPPASGRDGTSRRRRRREQRSRDIVCKCAHFQLPFGAPLGGLPSKSRTEDGTAFSAVAPSRRP